MGEVERKPDCPACGKGQFCLVEDEGRDRVTHTCGGCGNQVYLTLIDGDLVDSGLL